MRPDPPAGVPGAGRVNRRSDRLHRRVSPVLIGAITLITLVALGPLMALVVVFAGDPGGPADVLVLGPALPDDSGVKVTATIIGVSPSAGETRVRLVVGVSGSFSADGLPSEDLVLRVNDVRGANRYDLPAGQAVDPIEATLALADGQVIRYPFDRYVSSLVVVAAEAATSPENRLLVPVSVDLLAAVDSFRFTAGPSEGLFAQTPEASAVDVEISRAREVVFYAVAMMLLMWALAAAGLAMAWVVVIWGDEPPFWAYAYTVGVLFALPPLRGSLPGQPPPGTLVDYVAFYWAVAVTALTLLVLLGAWFFQARRQRHLVTAGEEPAAAEPPAAPPPG
ncbi:MAG: DUF4436 family protein [Acidimicrobiales bacterium]|nr:DUF4436 family protein [Acidimicrobiales bacterium]